MVSWSQTIILESRHDGAGDRSKREKFTHLIQASIDSVGVLESDFWSVCKTHVSVSVYNVKTDSETAPYSFVYLFGTNANPRSIACDTISVHYVVACNFVV